MIDPFANNLRLGERIRQRRQELNLSLRDLGTQTGLSATYLSGLERGANNPTLATIRRIANALQIAIYRLLADSREQDLIVRRQRRSQVTFSDSDVKYEMLTPQLNRKMLVYQLSISPSAGNVIQQPFGEPTEEFILVLSGRLEVSISGECYELETGDSIYFENRLLDSIRVSATRTLNTSPHGRDLTDRPVALTWVVTANNPEDSTPDNSEDDMRRFRGQTGPFLSYLVRNRTVAI